MKIVLVSAQELLTRNLAEYYRRSWLTLLS